MALSDDHFLPVVESFAYVESTNLHLIQPSTVVGKRISQDDVFNTPRIWTDMSNQSPCLYPTISF